MFGIFKKLSPLHRADDDIDSWADKVGDEGHIFASKVLGKLPKDYDETAMLPFLEADMASWESGQMTYAEYKNRYKTSFEFSCFMLHFVSRYFGAENVREIGEVVYQRMSERILDRFTDIYSSFMDGKRSDINLLLINMLNEREMEYSNREILFINENHDYDTVEYDVANKVCLITETIEPEELWRVMLHLHCSVCEPKFPDSLKLIKGGFKFEVQQLMVAWCSASSPRIILHAAIFPPALSVVGG